MDFGKLNGFKAKHNGALVSLPAFCFLEGNPGNVIAQPVVTQVTVKLPANCLTANTTIYEEPYTLIRCKQHSPPHR
jgi:hypothetical protein